MEKRFVIVALTFMASQGIFGFQGSQHNTINLPDPSSIVTSQSQSPRTQAFVWTDNAISSPLSLATVCLWAKSSNLQKTGSMFMYSTASSRLEFGLVSLKRSTLTTEDKPNYLVHLIVHGRKSSKPVSLRMDDVRWHYVCTTWQSSGSWRVFMDGDEVGSGYDFPASKPIAKDGRLYVGSVQSSLTYKFEQFVGKITGLMVWNASLSASDIKYAADCRKFNKRQQSSASFASSLADDTTSPVSGDLLSSLVHDWQPKKITAQWPASFYESEDICGSEVTVECNSNQMIISVNATRPRSLNIARSDLHLNVGSCTPTVRGRKEDFYVFELTDLTECKTTREVTETEVIYKNRVSNSPTRIMVVFYGYLYSADVSCHYPIDLTVSTRYIPPENDTSMTRTVMRDPRTNKEDMETIVLLYRDSAFKETLKNKPVVRPTDNIFVGMVIQGNLTTDDGSDDDVNVVVDRCYLRSLRQRKKIIDNQGCWSASPDIAMLENGRRSQARYRLPSSALSFTNGPVFVDCSVRPCIGGSCAPQCGTTSSGPSEQSRDNTSPPTSSFGRAGRRSKRQVVDTDNFKPEYYDISVGPLYAEGFWSPDSEPQPEISSRSVREDIYESPLFLGMITALCIVTVIGLMLIIVILRMKQKSESYAPNPVQITKHKRRGSTEDSMMSERPTSVTSPEPSVCSVTRAASFASMRSVSSFNSMASFESQYSQGNLDELSVDSLRFSASWH